MANEIPLDVQRSGELIDFDADTPKVSVNLRRSKQGVYIEVPWSAPDDHYATWFMDGAFQGMPEPSGIPKRLLFNDVDGPVMLVDCWAAGYKSSFVVGTGRVAAKYAVLGVSEDRDYLTVNGLRSDVSGLREWIGQRSIHRSFDSELKEMTITAGSVDAIAVGDSLTLKTTYGVKDADGGASVTLSEMVYCETESADPADWPELRRTHIGVRDLLIVSRWQPEVTSITHAMRHDDPLTTLDGEQHGHQWRAVIARGDVERQGGPSAHHQHLIKYDDLGVAGLEQWLSLRDEFARAIDPIISDRFLDGVGAVTHMAQVGPGLEALGYLLFLKRDGATEAVAGGAILKKRLDRILEDVKDAIPFIGEDWVKKTVASYNGIKHANRTLPTEVDLLNCWRESLMVMRAWIACELGIDPSTVKQRLALDWQNSPYKLRV